MGATQLDGDPLFDLGALQLSLIWADIDDLGSLRLEAGAAPADLLPHFLGFEVDGFLGDLDDLLATFEEMGQGDLLGIDIPFAGGLQAGNLFSFADGFFHKIYVQLVDICLKGSFIQDPTDDALKGRLSADATFSLTLGDETYDITLTASSTSLNDSLSDLVAEINAALDGISITEEYTLADVVVATLDGVSLNFCLLPTIDLPKIQSLRIGNLDPLGDLSVIFGFLEGQLSVALPRFATLQELHFLLNQALFPGGEGEVTFEFDTAAKRLTFGLEFSQDFETTTNFSVDPDLGLGDLADVSASGTIGFAAALMFDLKLGIDFNAFTTPRLTASFLVPPPSNGTLTVDSEFYIVLNDGDLTFDDGSVELRILLPKTAITHAGDRTSVAELVSDLNSLLASSTSRIGGKPVGEILRWVQSGTAILLEAINEDSNGNGTLDPGEDTILPNLTLDTQLNVVTSISLRVPVLTDPIITELGFSSGSPARSILKGLSIEQATLSGSVTPIATNLAAEARFAIFGVSTLGGGFSDPALDADATITHITVTLALQNPADATQPIDLDALLGDLGNIGSYLKPNAALTGALDFRLRNVTVTPQDVHGLTLPEDGVIRLFIPDIHHLDYNSQPYNATSNATGLFITYPEFGPVFNFSCLRFADIVLMIDDLADQLEQLKAFEWLGTPLPLINVSLSDVIDFADQIAQMVLNLSQGDSDTIETLESDLENLLGIEDGSGAADLIDLFVEDSSPKPTSIDPQAETYYNPSGNQNALKIKARTAGTAYQGWTINLVDDGTVTIADQIKFDVDSTGKILTIYYLSSYTTAEMLRAAMAETATPVDKDDASIAVPFFAVLDTDAGTGDGVGNLGSGSLSKIALKLKLNYNIAYGDSWAFAFDIDDLLGFLPADHPAQFLLAGIQDFLDLEGSANLNVTASADINFELGIDVSNPCNWKPFLDDNTGITLNAAIRGTNLSFKATVGGLGVWVKDGTVTLDADGDPETDEDAEFRVGVADNNGDGRHYFREGDSITETSATGIPNLDLHLTAGVSANLPLCFPTADLPFGGSTQDGDGDGYPDNWLVVKICSLGQLFSNDRTDAAGTTTVAFPGDNNDLIFTGTPNTKIKFLDTAASPRAVVNGDTLEIYVQSGVTTASAITALLPAGWSVVAAETSGAGTVCGAVQIKTPDFANIFSSFNPCDLITNLPLLLDGLDAVLGIVQSALESEVFDRDLPIVGDKLGDAAGFIEEFREGLLADIRTTLVEVGDPITLAKKAIWNVLGKPGLDILADPTDTNDADGVRMLETAADIDLGCTSDGFALEVNLRLYRSASLVDSKKNPINLDIGVPGIGLELEGGVTVEVGFDFTFGFGLSASHGFYFNTAEENELEVFFRVTIPGLTATGELFFLQVQAGDDPDDPSIFEGTFFIDFHEAVVDDGKVTFGELTSQGFALSQFASFGLSAKADINLLLTVSFGDSAVFPRIIIEFGLDWTWGSGDGETPGNFELTKPTIEFGLFLDLGSFVSKFIQPILSEIKKYTGPLDPLVELLSLQLPIISELFGEPTTMVDLAGKFGVLDPDTAKFLDALITISDLVGDTVITSPGDVLVDIGAVVADLGESGEVAYEEAPGSTEVDTLSEKTTDSGIKGFLQKLEAMGFTFPFLRVSELMKLLTGGSVSFVEFRAPRLHFEAGIDLSFILFPIFPPLKVTFGGEVSATIDLTFGFDTYGLQKLFSSEIKNLAFIAEGFYIKDVDDSGIDIPEIILSGGITAGLKLDAGIAEVGVKGGLFADIEFNLNDPDDDGKVRLVELVALALEDIRCIFDIRGELYVELSAYLKVKLLVTVEKEVELGHFTLLTFDLVCPQPVLADVDGHGNETEVKTTDPGVLTLHMGDYAAQREVGDTADGAEMFVVTHISGSGTDDDPESVEVAFNGIKQTYNGVKQIVVRAGNKNDIVDLRGVHSDADVEGGSGNDTLYASQGGGTYRGGDGEETVTGHEADTDFPGTLTGADTIYGDAGDDTLTGNVGDDTIDGGAGNDLIFGNDGADILSGGDGNDEIYGEEGDDPIEGGAGLDLLAGDDGNDVIHGGDGDDQIEGGAGDDDLIGDGDDDTLDGGAGYDILVGDSVISITRRLDASGRPSPGLIGLDGDGNDTLAGGGGDDVLFGVGGDDQLFGGTLMVSGRVTVIEADGEDFLDGGDGNDFAFGDDAHSAESTTFAGANIGELVWFDMDQDGIQDSDEPGIAGVSVSLYKSDGSLVGTRVTNSAGQYYFLGLAAGEYYLKFTSPDSSLIFTAQDSGSDDEFDSDVEVSGAAAGQTDTFVAAAGETQFSVDAGFTGGLPVVSIDNISIEEGDIGFADVTFTVSLSSPSDSTITVCYETLTDTSLDTDYQALSIVDFVSAAYTLVFNPGTTTQSFTVSVLGDTTDELNETFIVKLCDAFAGTIPLTIADDTGVATIIDDDNAPSISIADTSITELGDSSAPDTSTSMTFTVGLSNPSWQSISVNWTTREVTEAAGSPTYDAARDDLDPNDDFTAASGTLVFSPGQVSKTFKVTVNGDVLDENDERFFAFVSIDTTTTRSTAATVGDNQATGTIFDDDNSPMANLALTVGGPFVEGHAGYTTVGLNLTLDAPSGREVSVSWATADGTASEFGTDDSPADYLGQYETVMFARGETSKSVSVLIAGDTIAESAEYFFANLVAAINANLPTDDSLDNHVRIRIANDEVADPGPWYVQFSNDTYVVNEGEGPAKITLVRAAGSTEPVAIYWTTAGTATPGASTLAFVLGTADYVGIWDNGTAGTRGIIRFEADETTKEIEIPINDDASYEFDETVILHLANPKGGAARGAITTATLTIHDNDPLPVVTIADAPGAAHLGLESSPESTMDFTITVTGETDLDVTVNWTPVNGTGLAGSDFSAGGGTITLNGVHGSIPTTVKVTIIDDDVYETYESLYVVLSDLTNAELGDDPFDSDATGGEDSNDRGYGLILDNEEVTFEGRVFFDEDGNGIFDEGTDYGLSGVSLTVTDANGEVDTLETSADGTYSVTASIGLATVSWTETDSDLPAGSTASNYSNGFEFDLAATPSEGADSSFIGEAPELGFTVEPTGTTPTSSIGSSSVFYNDTLFGGPGNDELSGGGGRDWIVGGHWLGPGGQCDGDPYDATLLKQSDEEGGHFHIDPTTITANGTIGDHVYLDADGNGHRNSESGVSNVQVNLFDSLWQLIGTTFTDSNGAYRFEKLAPADYYVQFLPPAGYEFTIQNDPSGSGDVNDSDAHPQTGLTAKITIASGTSISTVDAGLKLISNTSPGPWAVYFGQSVYSVRETDGFAAITLLNVLGSIEPVAVYFSQDGAVSDGGVTRSATEGTDYRMTRGTVRFGAGESSKTFVVPVYTDDDSEIPETVFLYLANPKGGDVSANPPVAVLLILDNACSDDDILYGGDGDDILLGDYAYFESGAPVLLGGTGNDSIFGGASTDDPEDLTLRDELYGEGGRDTLDGGTGTDYLAGGADGDTYPYDADVRLGNDTIFEESLPLGGNDTLNFSPSSTAVIIDLADASAQVIGGLTLTFPTDVIENVTGGFGSDVLVGNSLDNILIGNGGDDQFRGLGGDDQLDGGTGNDTYYFNAIIPLGHDDIFEPQSSAIDTLDFSETSNLGVSVNLGLNTSQTVNANHTLTLHTVTPEIVLFNTTVTLVPYNPFTGEVITPLESGIENLYGGKSDDGTRAIDDVLIGNHRDNVIWGREGDDHLDGGTSGYDTLLEERAGNWQLSDTEVKLLDATETETLESNSYEPGTFDEISLIGDENVNHLDASSFNGVVRLDGRGGDDQITGGSGTNFLTGGDGSDTIDASRGTDTLIETVTGAVMLTDSMLLALKQA